MDFFQNIVLKKTALGNNNLITEPSTMHIAFGIDANFTIGTGVLIYSILQHNSKNMVFHIFTDNMYADDIARFKQLCNNNDNICIVIYYMNQETFSKLPVSFNWTQATYYRFAVCKYLQSTANSVLYLDSDILCLNNFEYLFEKTFNDKIAMVVSDIPEMIAYAKKNLSSNFKIYFNAGMMYINLREWAKQDISNKAIDLLQKNNFEFHDQDALNILLLDKTIILNNQFDTIYNLALTNRTIHKNTIFLHYVGKAKPWQLWAQYHQITKLWLKYKNSSPFKDVPILSPQTYKQAKYMGKMSRRNNKIFTSLYWYYKYSLWKIKTKLTL